MRVNENTVGSEGGSHTDGTRGVSEQGSVLSRGRVTWIGFKRLEALYAERLSLVVTVFGTQRCGIYPSHNEGRIVRDGVAMRDLRQVVLTVLLQPVLI